MKIQEPTFLLVMVKPTKYIKENKESRSFFNLNFQFQIHSFQIHAIFKTQSQIHLQICSLQVPKYCSRTIRCVFPKTSSSCNGTCSPLMSIPTSIFLSSSLFMTWVGYSWFSISNWVIKDSTSLALPLRIRLWNMQQ